MPPSDQPYAPPADDGGDQGSFTRPEESMAQANPAAPEDRDAAGNLWSAKQQRAAAGGGWGGALLTFGMFTLLATATVLSAYCNTH